MSELRKGYDPNFLGDDFSVQLPKLGLDLENDVLFGDEEGKDPVIDYIHYSVVMSKYNNQAYFSAANLNQNLFHKVSGREWFVDPRIGLENQIGPKAYKKNPWDRGHLTRRTAITWGDSKFIAKRASNDSCSYANAAMQHENFNQDEWRVPERIVQHFKKDKNGKISVFTGPVFTQTDRWYTRRILGEKVRIPSGFWKVIAYVDKDTESLACQAYVLYQDAQALIDKRGQKDIEIRNHQVTITEIEQLTGIEFDQSLFESNPLHFYPRDWDDKDDGPEGFLAPISTNKEDLDTGIVFSREMAESKEFESRKRKIPMEAFENLIHQIKEI